MAPPSSIMRLFKTDKNLKLISKADRPTPRPKGQKVSPEELRRVREMMRQRYTLDLEIWGLRNVRNHNREIVEDKMRRADALLACIRATVTAMDGRDYFSRDDDYQKLREIKARVMVGGRNWMQNPPWNED
ncbi:hypothetical protein AYO21_09475 [Fonsecaea monophora]|uniref:Uncharacterized protein n=1 Tax=Fonsecaea monophora TaxID=254056 RepID=A0A177EYG5_9EURO|nr:hypothetical protein AYO21_09475 [Fonsecaea monophora]KAH0837642.1 hypothetical protein FOPE_05229 [Fonsecaea pedrosoi]OAG36310.1 hypothetical protein AYO21_09475 [Fonsecaea monophora]